MTSANDKQIGGDHYKGQGDYQHWNVVLALNWDYLTGAATKYLWRLGKKGDAAKALEDIDKAIHYLQKKREVMSAELNAATAEKTAAKPRPLDAATAEYARRVQKGAMCDPNLLQNNVEGVPTRGYVDQG